MNNFEDLGITPNLLPALADLGYETPSAIQAQSIPPLLAGEDLLAQAQTGTGKTAAFALPILTRLNLDLTAPQVLILAPTRELAIQVAEAFQSYAKHIKGFHVLPIYGGQDFRIQLKALKRGVHVIVGTPGRVMDHMRRGTLPTNNLKTLVLDEADEMLNMGFVEDIEWILQQIPEKPQTALFSATMPASIVRISKQYLHNATKVQIQTKTSTVDTIDQNYILVAQHHKLEALTRFLEVEEFDAILIFTRTKTGSAELASKLEARGYAAAAMNGDMAQALRERVIGRLKRKTLDIIVATEVAARGLDLDRLSHVINYDIPADTESYVHRIGRTGRAGRKGKALLFVTPREQRMLRDIERATKQRITAIEPPSASQVSKKRAKDFTAQVLQTLASNDLDDHRVLIESIVHDHEVSELDVAAALASLAQKEKPIYVKDEIPLAVSPRDRDRGGHQRGRDARGRDPRGNRNPHGNRRSSRSRDTSFEAGMTRCRIEVGYEHGLQPGEVVGVIAKKADISSKHLGKIQIFDSHSWVDVSDAVVHQVIELAQNSSIRKHRLGLKPLAGSHEQQSAPKRNRPKLNVHTHKIKRKNKAGDKIKFKAKVKEKRA